MAFSLIPQYSFSCLTGISVSFVRQLGVRFLMLDLDNTIAAYDEHFPNDEIIHWIGEMKSGGVDLFIISNSRREMRVEQFAETLDIGFFKNARKPSTAALTQAMRSGGYRTDESALAGDQVFTDTLAANRAGIISIIVPPRKCTNLILSLRYAAEKPLRAACRNKM